MAQNRSMAIKHAKARKEAMKEAIAKALDKSAYELRQGDWAVAPSSLWVCSNNWVIDPETSAINPDRWTEKVLRRDTRTPLEQWGQSQLEKYGIDCTETREREIKCTVKKHERRKQLCANSKA